MGLADKRASKAGEPERVKLSHTPAQLMNIDLRGVIAILWGFGLAALCGLLALISLVMSTREGIRNGPHASGPTPWGRRLMVALLLGIVCAVIPYSLGTSELAELADGTSIGWGPLSVAGVIYAFHRAGAQR